jgi:phosphoserine phosphatase
MHKKSWRTEKPFTAIIFDVDGTLSAIEGIDTLAEQNGVGDQVKSLTSTAMGKTGINPELYKQRLDLVKPREEQVIALGQQYYRQRVPEAEAVIKLFQRLNKTVYMVSAGLLPAVSIFGNMLTIPRDNINAVNILFTPQGNYLDFDHSSPLVTTDGKRMLAAEIIARHHHVLHIGDGLNDYSSHDLVQRFVGYGGVYYRANIESLCQFYIKSLSMSALLPLALTQDEYELLLPEEKEVYQQGMKAIEDGEVKTS